MMYEIVSEGYVNALMAPAISNCRLGYDLKRLTRDAISKPIVIDSICSLYENEWRLGHLFINPMIARFLDSNLDGCQYEPRQALAWADTLRAIVADQEVLPSPTMQPMVWVKNNDGDHVMLPLQLIDALQTISDNGWRFFVREVGGD